MARILIIDDDDMICYILSEKIQDMGHRAVSVQTLAKGMEKAYCNDFDVIFLDVRLPDGNGLDALPAIRQAGSNPEVIIITGVGDAQGAEYAIKRGAWDYIQKPFSGKEIMLQLIRALEYREKKSASAAVSLKRKDIIGNSPQINSCLDLVAQSANNNANVLITGETGTGKELFAKAIHQNSLRSKNNFVVVDCTVLPEQLVESVLFGHIKGAFTGAGQTQEGLIKQADKGTLFLDEIGELPLSVQKAFLRVLQEHKFRPIGDTREVKSDFRLVSATNQKLDDLVKSGKFRQDLLFRVRTFAIELPPLRLRKQDIRELILHYIYKICEYHGLEQKGFSPEFIDVLENYNWPGNIRELVSTLEKAIFADSNTPILYPMHLPNHIRIQYIKSSVIKKQSKDTFSQEYNCTLDKMQNTLPSIKEFRNLAVANSEKKYLNHLISITNNNISKACTIAGLSRARFYALLKKYNISRTAH